MTISTALSNANSGLSAASKRADLVSSNISNALTPGYTRREASVSEQVNGGMGAGVRVDGVSRASDPVLTRERRTAEGAMGRDQTVASAYASLNATLGEPDDPFSLFGQYQKLESGLRSLAETPESLAYQNQVLDAATGLATTLNQLSLTAQNTRQDADTTIGREVASINEKLKRIEELNLDISRAGNSGRDVSALLDQRKTLIDEVSAKIPVREVPRGNGAVDLMTNEGVFLIAGRAKEISFTETGVITPDLDYNGGAGALSGLSVDGVDITPGGGGSFSVSQGTLAGLFAVRDEIAPAFQGQIDALARDVMERFEGIDPSLAPGDPGLFTDAGAAFNAANETGLAGRIAVNVAVDPAQGGSIWRIRDGLGAAAEGTAGDATLIRAMLDSFTELRTPPAGAGLSGQKSAADAAAGVTTAIGSARINAETRLASSSARAEAVIEAETAATGVDSDQELQKLILIEQAYAANARVLQTAQAMIETLMEI